VTSSQPGKPSWEEDLAVNAYKSARTSLTRLLQSLLFLCQVIIDSQSASTFTAMRWLRSLSTTKLVFTAVGGGIFVASFGLFVRGHLVVQQARRPFYQDAVRVCKRDPGAQAILGHPILDQV